MAKKSKIKTKYLDFEQVVVPAVLKLKSDAGLTTICSVRVCQISGRHTINICGVGKHGLEDWRINLDTEEIKCVSGGATDAT